MNKHIAVLLAAGLCLSCTALPGERPETALSVSAEEALPDWVPTAFHEVMRFRNTYGSTHVADGVICTVECRSENAYFDYQYSRFFGEGSLTEEDLEISMETYRYERPDPNDPNYDQILYDLGVHENELNYAQVEHHYIVTVYRPKKSGTLDVTYRSESERNPEPEDTNYTFDIAEDGTITETDLLGIFPDCKEELDAFNETNPGITVYNGYIVFSPGMISNFVGVYVEQEGTAEVQLVEMPECSRLSIAPPPPGGVDGSAGGDSDAVVMGGYQLVVYEPVSEGKIRMKFVTRPYWTDNPEYQQTEEAAFLIEEGWKITMIDPNEVIVPTIVAGDCDDDGSLGLTDVIMLQRYLLKSGGLTAAERADMDADGCVDAFDLCMMKRALLSGSGE